MSNKPMTRKPREKFSIDALLRRLNRLSRDVESRALYWLNPDDSCANYCRECAVKLVTEKVELDGGGGGHECDAQEFCETCGVHLECSFTNYGVEEEIDAATQMDEIDKSMAWTLARIIDCGVPRLTESCGDFHYRPDLLPSLKKIWRLLPKEPPCPPPPTQP
jgi:hypothetical protein